MLKSYIKIAYRNLFKRKFYSLINILGLSVGITFSLLIGVFIYNELQVDQQLKDIDRLYIIHANSNQDEMDLPILVFPPAARQLKEEYPHLVENYYRFWDRNITISKGDLHFREETLIGDPTLLDMFGYPVLYGDRKNPLSDPNSIVITKGLAIKYFGKEDVIGETLILNTEGSGKMPHKITAVLDNLPRHSVANLVEMNAQIFLPALNITSYGAGTIDRWDQMYMISYIKLAKGASIEKVKEALAMLVKKHAPENAKNIITLNPVPLSTYYLKDNNSAKAKLVFTLSTIVIFILLMAVINFINISIGTSTDRLREIGIRKAIGGLKKQLMAQFLTESIMITFLATIVSLILYQSLRSPFADILGRSLISLFDFKISFFLLVALMFLLIGIVAGIYPAFILSSYKSVESLKGKLKTSFQGVLFRRGLITFQFSLALFVFLSSVIISKQVSYFFNKDLGYNKSSVLTISSVPRQFTDEGIVKVETVKNELKRISSVEAASVSWEIPNGNMGGSGNFFEEGKVNETSVPVGLIMADEEYAATYGIHLKEGKFFQEKGEGWKRERLVLNEAAVKALNLNQPLGKIIKMEDNPAMFEVTGIVDDFNFFSLHEKVKPMAFLHVKNRQTYRYISLRIKPDNLHESIATIQKKWSELFPGAPFEYKFMDENLEQLYKSELQLKKASSTATYLSLIIVLLGVLGLVSLSLAKRMKEIGIRKVLGASIAQINLLFLKEFIALIVLANLIAWPLAYWLMDDWLQNFAYKINLGVVDFIWVSAILFLLTVLLICVQTSKTAMLNPVKSLRND